MLKKSYPMHFHDERPFSADELYPDKDHAFPNPDERGVCRHHKSKQDKDRPVQVVLIGPKEQEEMRKAEAERQAHPEPKDENIYPTAFAIYSHWPPDHHSRKCTVCNHPSRLAIEEEFLHWASPDAISHHYSVGWRAVYRHAHALGLFEERGRNLRSALGHIIEHANHAMPSAGTIVRAIRAYACLNESGQWIEPAKRVIFSQGDADPETEDLPDAEDDVCPEDEPLIDLPETDAESADPASAEASESAEGSSTSDAVPANSEENLIDNRAD